VDSHTVLTRLAALLHTNIAELSGSNSDEQGAGNYPIADKIRRAMMRYDALDAVIATRGDPHAPSAATLRAMVTHAYRDYQDWWLGGSEAASGATSAGRVISNRLRAP
jgi:hypothetical protein